MDPFIYFGVIFVYKILELSHGWRVQIQFPKLISLLLLHSKTELLLGFFVCTRSKVI